MTERTRALVDEKLQLVRTAIERGSDPVGVACLIAQIFPLCVDRRCAHAYIEAAFSAHSAHDLEIDPTTIEFVRPDA